MIGVYLGIISGWNRGKKVDKVTTSSTLTLYSMPEWWLGLLLIAAFAVGIGPLPGIFPTGGCTRPTSNRAPFEYVVDTAWHLTLPVITLTLAYLADYSLIMRSSLLDELGEDYLSRRAPRACATWTCAASTPCATRCCRPPPWSRSTSASWSPARSRSRRSSRYPGSACSRPRRSTLPDFWVLQGTFLIASAAVIFANLVANLVYGLLDPRVRT